MMKKMTLFLLLSISFSLLSFSAIADANKIVKWKDSDGITHYSDKLPSQDAGRSNTVIRNNGVVIKKNVIVDKKTSIQDQQIEQERLAQEHADKVLLASYTNASEIDLASERNQQMDDAALQSLSQNKQNLMDRMTENRKKLQALKTKNKTLAANLREELKQSQLGLNRMNKQIVQHQQNIEATRKRYQEEKIRFIALKQATANQNEPATDASLNTQ